MNTQEKILLAKKEEKITPCLKRTDQKKVSIELILKTYNYYLEDSNYTFRQLSKDLEISEISLIKNFKKLNLSKKSCSVIRHKKINDDFFEIIDSEIKAYLLGFFAADGHIEKRKDYYTYCLKIGLHKKDIEILELFNKYIANNLVKINYPKTKETMVTISIHSTKIGEDLLKLGYDNKKTYTCNTLPNINEKFINHFIRGYFDGDGSIIVNKQKKGMNTFIHLAAYNENILKEIFTKFNITKNKIYIKHEKNVVKKVNKIEVYFKQCFTYKIGDKENFLKIYDYLYHNANFFLKRKKDKFNQGINHIKRVPTLEIV